MQANCSLRGGSFDFFRLQQTRENRFRSVGAGRAIKTTGCWPIYGRELNVPGGTKRTRGNCIRKRAPENSGNNTLIIARRPLFLFTHKYLHDASRRYRRTGLMEFRNYVLIALSKTTKAEAHGTCDFKFTRLSVVLIVFGRFMRRGCLLEAPQSPSWMRY